MAEITAIDAFTESFGNRDFHEQVLQKSPATLSEALRWAICIEAIEDSGSPDGPIPFDHDGHCKDRGYAQAAAPEGIFSPPDDRRQLEQSLHECQTELERWEHYAQQ